MSADLSASCRQQQAGSLCSPEEKRSSVEFDHTVVIAEGLGMFPTNGYAAYGPTEHLKPFSFERRDPLPNDVQLDILFCGVSHSDLHTARNEWSGTAFPCVPGHEILGRVVKTGRNVRRFKEGDLAAAGCLVDSCGTCAKCEKGLEQYCDGKVLTYNSKDEHTGGITYGGYSRSIVVDQDFVFRVQGNLDPAAVAPLLCAGVTTYPDGSNQ